MNPFYESFHSHALAAYKRAADSKALKAVQTKAAHEIDRVFQEQLTLSGRKIDCKSGCFFCCHLKVDLGPAEAFLIADYIRATFSEAARAEVIAKAREYWKKTEHLSLKQQFLVNLPCPLLKDNQCSVYPVRPGVCRMKHSTRVAECERSFRDPTDDAYAPGEEIPAVKISTASAYIGVRDAMKDAGYDPDTYDLAPAIIEALSNPKCGKRWRDKKAAFSKNMRAKTPSDDPGISPTPI